MELRTWIPGLLVLVSVFSPADAVNLYDPYLCYILDGFLGLYGLIITGMFVREKFFKTKVKSAEDSTYSELRGQDTGGYAPLARRDPESGGRMRRSEDATYTGLKKQGGDEYKELPVKRDRPRKNDQVYQDLSAATRDTYQPLQMQPLAAR